MLMYNSLSQSERVAPLMGDEMSFQLAVLAGQKRCILQSVPVIVPPVELPILPVAAAVDVSVIVFAPVANVPAVTLIVPAIVIGTVVVVTPAALFMVIVPVEEQEMLPAPEM